MLGRRGDNRADPVNLDVPPLLLERRRNDPSFADSISPIADAERFHDLRLADDPGQGARNTKSKVVGRSPNDQARRLPTPSIR